MQKTMKRFFNIHLCNLCAFIGNVFFGVAVQKKKEKIRQKTIRCKTMNNLSFGITRLFLFLTHEKYLKLISDCSQTLKVSSLELPD